MPGRASNLASIPTQDNCLMVTGPLVTMLSCWLLSSVTIDWLFTLGQQTSNPSLARKKTDVFNDDDDDDDEAQRLISATIEEVPSSLLLKMEVSLKVHCLPSPQGRHLRGTGGPSPPQGKRKKEEKENKKKEKKEKKKKEKKERKKKKKERKEGTMNNIKLLHIKCCFFPIFQ